MRLGRRPGTALAVEGPWFTPGPLTFFGPLTFWALTFLALSSVPTFFFDAHFPGGRLKKVHIRSVGRFLWRSFEQASHSCSLFERIRQQRILPRTGSNCFFPL